MIYGLILVSFIILSFISIKPTNNGFDFNKGISTNLKGIAATWIFLHHMVYIFKDNIIYEPIKYFAFPMVGVFFFISGYGLSKSKSLNLSKKLIKLLVPFALTIILFAVYNLIFNNSSFWSSILFTFNINNVPQYWFIYEYIILVIAYQITKKMDKNNASKIMFFL